LSPFIWHTWRDSPAGVAATALWRRRGAGLRESFVDSPPHALFGPFELLPDDPPGDDRADRVQEAIIADLREAAESFDWVILAANVSGQSAVSTEADARRVYEETLREGLLVNWYEGQDDYVIGGEDNDGARLWTAEIEAISLGFWAAHPEHFVPFRFRRAFDAFRQLAREFEIAVPEPPGEKSWFERALYYLTLNSALLEFGRRFGMSTVELCAFLYDFAPAHLASEVDPELPPARTIWWLHGGTNNNGDFEFLETATQESTSPWQGNEHARRGDIAVVYCLAPHSVVHSIWRIIGDGFYDPFSYFSQVVTIGRPINGIPKITSAELAADSTWQTWPATRARC
jgi:hypothetical protein